MAEKTKVIFKKFPEGDVIAIFPEELGSIDYRNTCMSYQVLGQHSSCDIELLLILDLAQFSEYKDLKSHLESLGYNLEIYAYLDLSKSEKIRLKKLVAWSK